MKQPLMLVGGGVIARHYKSGLENSRTLRLVALVDKRADCVARQMFDVPFFTDLQAALKLNPSVAVLALPPASRVEIAEKLLTSGVTVLTEKPMCQSLEDAEYLLKLSAKTGTPIKCLYHWKAADEVKFLKENIQKFGKIRSVCTTICDDYAFDGSIRPDRRGLLGAWYDSGINVLSYYDEIFDLSSARTVSEEGISDEVSGQLKFVRKKLEFDGVTAQITVDWTTSSSAKTSEIICDSGVVRVNHSKQNVELNGETIFSREVPDRLSSHYENLFRDFELTGADTDFILHKILFKGNTK